MFKKVLIVNRGEIALRIIRACRELGIKTVSVYSEADRDSLHVQMADESICIGPPSPRASYLNIPAIISAAEISGVDAIHPGYGFLAENSKFAEICTRSNLIFIGPTAESISLMGNKINAKKAAKKAGIPLIPGSLEGIKNLDKAKDIANKIGYPVIIKTVAGGGGKGMNIARSHEELSKLMEIARTEALSSFGNDEIYIEKFFENPRHIEIQIMADRYGNAIYLGERDCSIQRRYQKLVEEAPSPAVTPKLRREMGEYAVKMVKKTSYSNVGTIEFLLDSKGNFYFCEMNTRIQVEHPVTELVTGIDILKWQILLAAGEKLTISQKDVKIGCHAIECRINAESPNTFLPSPGKITRYHQPGGFGVRVDSAIYQGYMISPYYDSLLSKVICWGNTREEALIRMRRALGEFIVEGIETNIPLHLKILNNEEFIKGNYGTSFLKNLFQKNEQGITETPSSSNP